MPFKNKFKRSEYMVEYRLKHEGQGLCKNCTNAAIDGYMYCSGCLEKRREARARWRKKHKEKVKGAKENAD